MYVIANGSTAESSLAVTKLLRQTQRPRVGQPTSADDATDAVDDVTSGGLRDAIESFSLVHVDGVLASSPSAVRRHRARRRGRPMPCDRRMRNGKRAQRKGASSENGSRQNDLLHVVRGVGPERSTVGGGGVRYLSNVVRHHCPHHACKQRLWSEANSEMTSFFQLFAFPSLANISSCLR
jgi:hypothetical protein